MSYFICGHCGERSEIFSCGGGERAAEKFGVPFLGRIPIDPMIREGGDQGMPIVVAQPMSPQAALFKEVTENLVKQIRQIETSGTSRTPSISNILEQFKKPVEAHQ